MIHYITLTQWLAGSSGAKKREEKKKKGNAVQFLCQGILTITFTLFLSMDPHLCRGTPAMEAYESPRLQDIFLQKNPTRPQVIFYAVQ